jgi:hypothetical protein
VKTGAKAPIRHIRKIPRLKIPGDLAGVLGDIAVRAATLRKNRRLDSESEAAIFLHAAAGLHVQNAINHFLSQRAYELLLAELRKKTAPSSDLVASINSLLEQLSAEDVSPFEQMRALYCYRDPVSDGLDTIEKDIALMMEPRSKFNRLVFSGRLVPPPSDWIKAVGSTPHLASALLNHTDPRVTEEHYNRASSISSGKIYAEITNNFLRD